MLSYKRGQDTISSFSGVPARVGHFKNTSFNQVLDVIMLLPLVERRLRFQCNGGRNGNIVVYARADADHRRAHWLVTAFVLHSSVYFSVETRDFSFFVKEGSLRPVMISSRESCLYSLCSLSCCGVRRSRQNLSAAPLDILINNPQRYE